MPFWVEKVAQLLHSQKGQRKSSQSPREGGVAKVKIIAFIAVFFAVFFADISWTFYIRRVAQGKVLQAAVFSAIILLLGGITTMSYVTNGRLTVIPAVCGAFCGTFVAMKIDQKRKK